MSEFKEVNKVLNDFGKRVTKLAQINLGATRVVDGKRRRTDNSSKLRKSVGYQIVKNDKGFNFGFKMEDYGIFVDGGRDGTKRKRASKDSVFYSSTKTGKGMPQERLLSWIKSKPVRVRDLKTNSFAKQTESRVKSLAFLINRKIKEQGIAATNFISDPFNTEFANLPEKLAIALSKDLEEIITDEIDGDISE